MTGELQMSDIGRPVDSEPKEHPLAIELRQIRAKASAFNELLTTSPDSSQRGHSITRLLRKGKEALPTGLQTKFSLRSAGQTVKQLMEQYEQFTDKVLEDENLIAEIRELGNRSGAEEAKKPLDPSDTDSIIHLIHDIAASDIFSIRDALAEKFHQVSPQRITDSLIQAIGSPERREHGFQKRAIQGYLRGWVEPAKPTPWGKVIRESSTMQSIFGNSLNLTPPSPSPEPEPDTSEPLGEGKLYPSSPEAKQRGLNKLVTNMDEVLTISSPGERLRKIHELVSPAVDLNTLPEHIKRAFETDLLIYDRSDGNELWKKIEPKILELAGQCDNGTLSKLDLITRSKEILAEEARKNTSVTLDTSTGGALRSYGTRTIDGVTERVFASHLQIVEPELSVGIRSMARNVWPAISYFGLSAGFDEVFERFSQKYMSLPAESLEDWARREAFFQLIGSTLHPFLDGNSRALFGFLMASARERGLDGLDDPQRIETIVKRLEPHSDQFLRYSQGELSNLGWVKDSLHFNMLNPKMRADYMKRLQTGLEKAIDQGVDGTGRQTEIIDAAATIILNQLNTTKDG